MKQLTICLLCLLQLSIVAQDQNREDEVPMEMDIEEFQTVMNEPFAIGGYIGLQTHFGTIQDQAATFVGGQAVVIMNHSIGIGGGGYGLVSNIHNNGLGHSERLLFGYGGIIIEPILMPKKMIHASFPILIGGGFAAIVDQNHYNDIDWDDEFRYENAYFVIEPRANIDINFTRFFRISTGVGYRFLDGGGSNAYYKTSDLEGLSGNVTFKFGWF